MTDSTVSYRFKVRGGTAAALASVNETPLFRELVFETDTGLFKLGDGLTPYVSLPYGMRDDSLTLSDVTTNNASTTKHGFLKKLSNVATEFMNGQGNWATPADGAVGAMSYVGSATVAGAAATTLTISGLDLAVDGRYRIEVVLKNNTASLVDLSCFVSGDTTATNYDYEIQSSSGATVSGARANAAIFADMAASADVCGYLDVQYDFNLKSSVLARFRSNVTTGIKMWVSTVLRRTVGNVTSLTISGSVANCLAIGSTIRVWKVTT